MSTATRPTDENTLPATRPASPRRKAENVPGEDIDRALREINQLHQRWNQGLSIKNLAFAERYLKAELEFGFVFVARSPEGDVPAEYVAIFERKAPVVGLAPFHRSLGNVLHARPSDVELYSKYLMRRGYRDEQLVFVGDVETVQLPQGVVCISTVRLQRTNEFYRLCGRPLQSGDAAGIEMRFVRTYWEGTVVAGRSAVVLDESDCQQIEGRSEIVDAVPQDARPFVGDWNVEPEAVNFAIGVRFLVDHDAIRMERVKGIDGRFEVRKMFFGPVDLYAAPAQRIGHREAP